MNIYEKSPEIICRRLVPIKKSWSCPKCDTGEMISTGEAYMTNPPMYFHVCDKCGDALALRGGQKFPRIDYE